MTGKKIREVERITTSNVRADVRGKGSIAA